jgi:hypothetical protein
MAEDCGRVTHIGADGSSKRVVAKTGRPNGLATDRNGAVVRRMRTEARLPTNLAFGREGSHMISVTTGDELGTIGTFDVGVDGLPLFVGPD